METAETSNELQEDSNFANISVLSNLGQYVTVLLVSICMTDDLCRVLMPDIRKLRDLIKPSHTNRGDGMCSATPALEEILTNVQAISSIVIAIQMIITYCKKLKYKREIVLVTNGNGVMNSEGLDEIQKKITEDSIKLTVL